MQEYNPQCQLLVASKKIWIRILLEETHQFKRLTREAIILIKENNQYWDREIEHYVKPLQKVGLDNQYYLL